MVEFPEQRLLVFDGEHSYYAFTQPGHPAHPAWITRKLVSEQDGRLNMIQIGYFAGREPPFAELFRQYQVLTQTTIEALKTRERRK